VNASSSWSGEAWRNSFYIPVSAIGHSIKEFENWISILNRTHPFDQGDLMLSLKLARLGSPLDA